MISIMDEFNEVGLIFRRNIASGYIAKKRLEKLNILTFLKEVRDISHGYGRTVKYIKFIPASGGGMNIQIKIPVVRAKLLSLIARKMQ